MHRISVSPQRQVNTTGQHGSLKISIKISPSARHLDHFVQHISFSKASEDTRTVGRAGSARTERSGTGRGTARAIPAEKPVRERFQKGQTSRKALLGNCRVRLAILLIVPAFDLRPRVALTSVHHPLLSSFESYLAYCLVVCTVVASIESSLDPSKSTNRTTTD